MVLRCWGFRFRGLGLKFRGFLGVIMMVVTMMLVIVRLLIEVNMTSLTMVTNMGMKVSAMMKVSARCDHDTVDGDYNDDADGDDVSVGMAMTMRIDIVAMMVSHYI